MRIVGPRTSIRSIYMSIKSKIIDILRSHVAAVDMPSPARFSPDTPYNALPPLPPRVELETKAVMKALVGARAALAELKQAGELIPNPARDCDRHSEGARHRAEESDHRQSRVHATRGRGTARRPAG